MLSESIQSDERTVLVPLAFASFFQIVDMMVINPLGAWVAPDLAISTSQFSLLVLAYNFASAAVGLGFASLLDRHDRRLVLFAATASLSLVTLGAGLAPGFAALLVLRFMAGACGGLVASQALALIGDLIAAPRRGRAVGFVMASFGVASVVGIPLSLLVASHFGWRASFLALGVLGLPVAALTLMLPSVPAGVSEVPAVKRFDVYRQHAHALLISACISASAFLIIPFISLYYVSHVGVRESQLGLVYIVGGIAATLFMKKMGTLVDALSAARSFLILALLSIVPIVLLTNLGAFGVAGALVASTLFFCLMTGRTVPLNALLISMVPAHRRGGFMSVNTAFQAIGVGAGAALGGVLSSLGGVPMGTYPLNGAVAAGLTLVAVFAALKPRH